MLPMSGAPAYLGPDDEIESATVRVNTPLPPDVVNHWALRVRLPQMASWLRYAVAIVVAAHGFVYVGPLSPTRTHTDWSGSGWALAGGLSGDRLKTLAWALHIVAAIATLACAGAIAFPSAIPGWWRPLAIISGAAGFAAFFVVWDGRPESAFSQGGVGAVVSLTLIAIAIARSHWFD